MNFHSDDWINAKVTEHLAESQQYYTDSQIVGIFYQGSGNYGLDYEDSDVDTKLILSPSFKDIAMNRQPISTTHVRANAEHIDWKDVRLYLQTFRKQNPNFVEILFTKYCKINSIYEAQWQRLVASREAIGRLNQKQAIKAAQGVAKEKFFALEHRYPSRTAWLDKYGYDPKQLHHLLRMEDFIKRYVSGELYVNCLVPDKQLGMLLIETKRGNAFTLTEARLLAAKTISHIDDMCAKYLELIKNEEVNGEVEQLLDDVQYNIIKIAVEKELASNR